MTMSITLAWWHVPTIITVLALAWALFWPVDDAGYLTGIDRLFMLVPTFAVLLIVWIIAAVLK